MAKTNREKEHNEETDWNQNNIMDISSDKMVRMHT